MQDIRFQREWAFLNLDIDRATSGAASLNDVFHLEARLNELFPYAMNRIPSERVSAAYDRIDAARREREKAVQA